MGFLCLRQAYLHLVALKGKQPRELLWTRQEMPGERIQAIVREELDNLWNSQSRGVAVERVHQADGGRAFRVLQTERGIDISHETVRFWWNRFGPMFAAEIRKRRVAHMRGYPQWRWHLDEAFVKVNGKLCYLWRAVDHEGEVLEAVVTAKRDKAAALKFLKRIMKKYGRPLSVVTDGLCSYPAAMKEIGNADRQEAGRKPRRGF